MQTSIQIDPALLKAAKIRAIREERSLSSVIREMLKNWVNEPVTKPQKPTLKPSK